MCGLNVYSYIEDTYIQFYKVHRAQAKKMDIGDWIPGFFHQEVIQGGESLLDRVRRIIPEELAIIPAPVPLMELHPGEPSGTAAGEVEEEEEEERDEQEEHEEHEGEGEEFATGYTQESEAPLRKKAMRVATPQSKLVPVLTVEDAREMYSRDATATFREKRLLKGKKLYGDYSMEETIAISSEDEDDFELGKRLVEEPSTSGPPAGNAPVKPEALTVAEANERMRRADEPSVRDEVAELRALVLEQQRQRAMIQPPNPMDLVAQVIEGFMARGLVVGAPGAFPHLPAGFPPQNLQPQALQSQLMPPPSYPFLPMVAPHPRPYAPVQQVDDPSLWRQGAPGSSRPLTPPPLRPPITQSPAHQQDDLALFGSADPNPPAPAVPQTLSLEAREFGSADPNLVGASTSRDDAMVEAEGSQGPGDASTLNPIDEPMHDGHAEVGLSQRPDTQPLDEQVVAEVKQDYSGDIGGPAQEVALSTSPRPDQGEVMH